MRFVHTVIVLPMLLVACSSYKLADGLDPDRVLSMAGQEAAQIADPTERLGRQLNIAHRQITNGQPADARQTLASARQTLESIHDATLADRPPLSDHHRLAGWISISELAREAEDPAMANAALDRALSHLNQIQPPQARCEYVPGIAREVRKQRGDAAAATLLISAGQWATQVPELPTRRAAYLAFAEELFRASDYEAARAMLRRDDNPSWRSDALLALADFNRYGRGPVSSAWFGLVETRGYLDQTEMQAGELSDLARAQAAPTTKPFGKAVDFRSTFYRPR